MKRADDDSWDLATSVGATATMVAAHRAAASKRVGRVIDDPFAEPLVRAVGVDYFTRVAAGELDVDGPDETDAMTLMTSVFEVRARFFDDFLIDTVRRGVGQVVIVASGLDTRAYRLPWPAGTMLYEIDQPEVIDFKNATLAGLGAGPTAALRAVSIDLRHDWPTALRQAGFDADQPTVWLAEGLMIGFLPPLAQDGLLDDITALSAAGSRFAGDYTANATEDEHAAKPIHTVTDGWREHGLDIDMADLTYPGTRMDVAAYLQAHGWDAVGTTVENLFAAYGRAPSDLGMVSWIDYVTADRN